MREDEPSFDLGHQRLWQLMRHVTWWIGQAFTARGLRESARLMAAVEEEMGRTPMVRPMEDTEDEDEDENEALGDDEETPDVGSDEPWQAVAIGRWVVAEDRVHALPFPQREYADVSRRPMAMEFSPPECEVGREMELAALEDERARVRGNAQVAALTAHMVSFSFVFSVSVFSQTDCAI